MPKKGEMNQFTKDTLAAIEILDNPNVGELCNYLETDLMDTREVRLLREKLSSTLRNLKIRRQIVAVGDAKPKRWIIAHGPVKKPGAPEWLAQAQAREAAEAESISDLDEIRVSDLRDLVLLLYKQRAEINQLKSQLGEMRDRLSKRQVSSRTVEKALAECGE